MKALWTHLFYVILCFCIVTAAQAAEVITAFDADIAVQADAAVVVTETIEVVSEQREIRRGIYRDIPLRYEDRLGNRRSATLDVLEVRRDGRAEPYRVERQGAGLRIYIGDPDVVIPRGRHRYEITYRSDRQLGHLDGFDEIYWNVTGTDWIFPIEQTTATVTVPPGAMILEAAAYTGRPGESGRDYEIIDETASSITVATTRTLGPGEGLTVAVSWPEGFVPRPTTTERLQYFLRDNASAAAGLIGLGLVLAYFSAVWRAVGRDPEGGVIIAQYEPPDGFSPAASRYVSEMGYDRTAFTAAVVNMAVKGALKIRETGGDDFSLEQVEGADLKALSKGERALWMKLFDGGRRASIDLKNRNHKIFKKAQKALERHLETEFEQIYFRKNTKAFLPGVMLAAAAILFVVILSPRPEIGIFMAVWSTIWIGGTYRLVTHVGSAWSGVLSGRTAYHRVTKGMTALFSSLFALPFLLGAVLGAFFLSQALSVIALLLIAAIILASLAFYHWLKAPTRLGREILDKIQGFKRYLTVAEKQRMAFHNPPDKTPDLFETYLPYALALGVEHEWSEQFDNILAKAAKGGEYQPGWYVGRRFGYGHYGDMGSRLSSGFTGALATASAAPRSSGSGSFGGGGVGGGGGGGGGGGW